MKKNRVAEVETVSTQAKKKMEAELDPWISGSGGGLTLWLHSFRPLLRCHICRDHPT